VERPVVADKPARLAEADQLAAAALPAGPLEAVAAQAALRALAPVAAMGELALLEPLAVPEARGAVRVASHAAPRATRRTRAAGAAVC
jgi:hypothetical protein